MKTPRLVELESEPVVGQFYWVPTVTGDWCYRKSIALPVLLPGHDDAGTLRFPHFHYHPDPRFMTDAMYGSLARNTRWRYSDDLAVAGTPLMSSDRINPNGLPPVVERRRKCLRAMPDRRYIFARKPFVDLVDEFKGRRLKPGMVCPHRGTCLKAMPVVDGAVECPTHGLRWNVATGELVTE